MVGASIALVVSLFAPDAFAGEASLVLPDLRSVDFLGVSGWSLLLVGIGVSIAGLVFGLTISSRLKRLPVHRSMLEISELIYETCKTYLITQGKFIALLWAFIGVIMVVYFGVAAAHAPATSVIRSSPSASSASSAATAWPGSASGSTPSPTAARRSPRSRASRSRRTPSRSRPA